MARKFLRAAKCSQMSDPNAGTGTGGDRCTETATAIVDATYEIGPRVRGYWIMIPALQEKVVEAAMYSIVELWNNGADTSALEPGSKIAQWVADNSGGKITLLNHPTITFQTVKDCIDRQHIIVAGVNDYSQMHTYDGSDPYKWPETEHAGHAFVIVGYDDDFVAGGKSYGQTLIVHDGLRAYDGMPYDYLASSVHLSSLAEVMGPALSYEVNSEAKPVPTPAPVIPAPTVPALADWQAYSAAIEKWLVAAPKPPV